MTLTHTQRRNYGTNEYEQPTIKNLIPSSLLKMSRVSLGKTGDTVALLSHLQIYLPYQAPFRPLCMLNSPKRVDTKRTMLAKVQLDPTSEMSYSQS